MNEKKEVTLKLIEQMWQLYPEWRLGQLVANVAEWADTKIWDIEDEDAVEVMREHLRKRQSNQSI
jgi:hypothetical protein